MGYKMILNNKEPWKVWDDLNRWLVENGYVILSIYLAQQGHPKKMRGIVYEFSKEADAVATMLRWSDEFSFFPANDPDLDYLTVGR